MLELVNKNALRQISSQAITEPENRGTPVLSRRAGSLAPKHMEGIARGMDGVETGGKHGGGGEKEGTLACHPRFGKGIHSSSLPGERSGISHPW